MALIAVILSVILNIWLIPKYKVLGAAAANAISQLFTLFFHVIVTRQKFKLKVDIKLLIRGLLFIMLSILTGLLVSRTSVNWITGIILISSISLISSLLIGLVKISTIIDFAKNYLPGKELSTS